MKSGRLESHSFKIDNLGNPHFVFSFSYGLYYLKWDGENMVCADKTIYDWKNKDISNPGNFVVSEKEYDSFFPADEYPSFDLDKNGFPHIVWEHDSCLYYIKWNGYNWVCFDGSIFGSENKKLTNPANVKAREGLGNLKIAINNMDYPYITWDSYPDDMDNINIIKLSGKNWNPFENIFYDPAEVKPINTKISDSEELADYYIDNVFASHCFSTVIDDNNTPHFVFEGVGSEGENTSTFIKNTNRSFTRAINVTNNPNNMDFSIITYFKYEKDYQKTSLDLDKNGFPHITWINAENFSGSIYYARWDGKNWVSPTKEIPLKNEKFKYRKR